ncbi:MAG: hypothetical protein K0R67_2730, partial [Paenibacillus sp.]|nr:hypothetical protein [Paenibacillus sp.]
LRRFGSAIFQLILFILSFVSYVALVFLLDFGYEYEYSSTALVPVLILLFVCGGALTIWIIVDLFLIPRMIREWNARVEQDIVNQIVRHRQHHN